MAEQKPLPRELFAGAQNDILYLLDGRPCASNDCPPHEDGPNLLAKLATSTQWDIDLCTAITTAYNDRPRLLAEVDRLTAERDEARAERDRAIAAELRRLVATHLSEPHNSQGEAWASQVMLTRAAELDPEGASSTPARGRR